VLEGESGWLESDGREEINAILYMARSHLLEGRVLLYDVGVRQLGVELRLPHELVLAGPVQLVGLVDLESHQALGDPAKGGGGERGKRSGRTAVHGKLPRQHPREFPLALPPS
jgi:hypothetical protein